MKKRSIALIIGLMSFALLGVMAMQLNFLKQSYQMQSDLFDRSVNEALNNVVAKISKHDALNFLNVKAQGFKNGQNSWNAPVNKENGDKVIADSALTKKSPHKKLTRREKQIAIWRDSLRRMIMHKRMDDEMAKLMQEGTVNLQIHLEEFTDEFGVVHGRVTPILVRNPPSSGLKKHQKLHKYDTVRYTYSDPQFGKQIISIPHINAQWQQEQDRKLKERQLREVKKLLENDSLKNTPPTKSTVIENLAAEYNKYGEPLQMRLNPFWIDTLLRI